MSDVIAAAEVSLTTLRAHTRFVFRGPEGAVQALTEAFAVSPSRAACRAAVKGERAALWLGPDEWLLLAPPDENEAIAAAIAERLSTLPHSLVDVSHRQTALKLSGARATTVLAGGNPLDLDLAHFPVDMCTRTVLGKAEIVLWRTAEQEFHIEVWRSFAPYVWSFLREHMREFGN